MVFLGLVVGLAEANADLAQPIPLTVCTDSIEQNYSGLLAPNSLSRIDYNRYTDADCNTAFGTDIVTTGTLALHPGSSSFLLCYNDGADSLPLRICSLAGCNTGPTTCSFQVNQIRTTTGEHIANNGNCVNVTCNSGSPTGWSEQLDVPMVFS